MFFVKYRYRNITKNDLSHIEGLITFTSRECERKGSHGICRNTRMENVKMKLKEIMGDNVD
jgi:hypothetical protein